MPISTFWGQDNPARTNGGEQVSRLRGGAAEEVRYEGNPERDWSDGEVVLLSE